MGQSEGPPRAWARLVRDGAIAQDADALRIEAQDMFNVNSLLPKALAARARCKSQGISDSVEATQQ